jgi:S-formylglutathione hydrolase
MSDQYVGNLRQLKAIGLDVGNKDPNVAIGAQLLDRVLTTYGIAHPFEIYDGDHINHIAESHRN